MKHLDELNLDGLEFPMPCCERAFKKFENNNNVSVAVYGHEIYKNFEKGKEVEKRRIIPLYVPTVRRETAYHIFFYKNEDGTKWHYNPIKSLRGLVSQQMYVCMYVKLYLNTLASTTIYS